MNVTRRPEAIDDLIELADYISEDNPDAADRFLDAFEETALRLGQFPDIGTTYPFHNPRLHGVRRWFVQGFEKYLIFYLVLNDEVEIIRVLHSSRDVQSVFLDDQGV